MAEHKERIRVCEIIGDAEATNDAYKDYHIFQRLACTLTSAPVPLPGHLHTPLSVHPVEVTTKFPAALLPVQPFAATQRLGQVFTPIPASASALAAAFVSVGHNLPGYGTGGRKFMTASRKEEVDAARHCQEKREATRLGKLLSYT